MCNNGYEETGEECDDGDSDDSNGCTIDCKYSCVTGDDSYPACDNPCDPLAYCDDATHTCIADAPLADDTICLEGAGYCSEGVCVLSVCGDGVVQPNEDCDSADPAADPTCQPDCTLGICGNGVIEGREQCDDGNTDKLDGCGPECKAEIIASPVTFGIVAEDAPDFCVYEGNAFGEFMQATMESLVETMQSEEAQQMVDDFTAEVEANQDTTNVEEDMEPMIPLFHLFDIDDLSMTSPDSSMYFGLSFATAETDPERTGGMTYMGAEGLDFPVNLYRVCYNDQLDPIVKAELELKIENDVPVIYSKEPFAMGFKLSEDAITDDMRAMMDLMALLGIDMSQTMDQIMNLQFVLRNINLRMEVDPPRSKMPAPPETASETFESAGHFDPAYLEQVYENTGGMFGEEDSENFEIDLSEMGNPFDIDNELLPTGSICGTIHTDTLGSIGLPNINMPLLGLTFDALCPNEGSQIVPCRRGMSPEAGDCTSVLDFLRMGCTGGDLLTLPQLGEPDADTDGDDINDSYNVAIRLSIRRLKQLAEFAEGSPLMQPAAVD